MRLVLALGGNAIAPPGTGGSADEQTDRLSRAAEPIADLVADGYDVVITHGNGPQVGNLLLKNELAADIVPAMPLHWCVAQTQATIGFTLVTALDQALAARGVDRRSATIITRVRVDASDPAFERPTKPIGRWLPDGTRRLVPSPRPVEILDIGLIGRLVGEGVIVIACGGGGIPMVEHPSGLRGVEAVIDKDRAAALLAAGLDADRLVVLTDVHHVEVGHGRPDARALTSTTTTELERLLADDQFPDGSMGPKVEAVAAFAAAPGHSAAIGHLDQLGDVVHGSQGTQIR